MQQSKPLQSVTVLGATGSIGRSTLDVIARHPDRYRVYALTAQSRLDDLAALCRSHRPELAVVGDARAAQTLSRLFDGEAWRPRIEYGAAALFDAACASGVDAVMAAIVGAAGLAPALAAARAGKRLLLANKEAMVMAGPIMIEAVRQSGAQLLPVDSEHSAIFQCLPCEAGWPCADSVRRLILTASGGPFRSRDPEQLNDITPDQACAHPNWVMGRKISVDSATMMNKGLEVIEARWLFGVARAAIEVVIHPQSVVHSMVEFADGSVVAQLGTPDMRGPISHALAYPERIESGAERLDFTRLSALTFEPPSLARFPCLGLAFDALDAGAAATIALNAANEVAVEAFLGESLRFTDIARVVERTLGAMVAAEPGTIDAVIDIDQQARSRAREFAAAAARVAVAAVR
ncbi:1-deoxy-D-xylulose-5-phosphate reductoisomerase [soil metagenome]